MESLQVPGARIFSPSLPSHSSSPQGQDAYPDHALFNYLSQALAQPLDPATQVNAYDHVWGHFKKLATDQEKAHYLDLRQAFLAQQIDRQAIKSYLNHLCKTYQDKYLNQSYFFYGMDKSIPL